MTIIRVRRGNKANLPASAPSGMPLWCEDTKELYLGTGSGIELINEAIIGGNFKAYAANSGKTNASGYADFITKGSNTEIGFAVGGTNPNLEVTFPSGKHYVISSISNIQNITSDGNYAFILYESDLTDNGDGTYKATATKINLGYDYKSDVNILTGFTSNTKDGITLSGNYSTPWYACDGNSSTAWTPPIQTLCGNPYPFIPGNGGAAYITINFPTLKKFHKVSLSQLNTGYIGSGMLQFSNNGGTSWTDITGIGGVGGSTQEINIPDTAMAANAVRFYFTACGPWHSAGGDCGTCGMMLHQIGLYEVAYMTGVNITENILLPASGNEGDLALLINQESLISYIRANSAWTKKEFIKLGEVARTAGIIGTPISYAFNGSYFHEFMSTYNNYYDKQHNIGSDILKSQVYVDYGGYWHDLNDGGASVNEGIRLAHKKNSIRVNLGKTELIDMSLHTWNVGTVYTANTRLIVERGF